MECGGLRPLLAMRLNASRPDFSKGGPSSRPFQSGVKPPHSKITCSNLKRNGAHLRSVKVPFELCASSQNNLRKTSNSSSRFVE
jgi:hypothetical protein